MKPANGIYGGRINQKREDPTRCVEAIWNDTARGHYQCRNKRKEGPGLEYCGIHNPDKIAARDEAKRKKYEAAREQRWDVVMRRQNLALREALKPFAEFAKMFEVAREMPRSDFPTEGEWYVRDDRSGRHVLTVEMFDQARKVIEGES